MSNASVTSNASNRDEMRQFMNRFRVQDNSLMSFDAHQRRQINDFQRFAAEKPDGTCSVCLKKLYPEERRFRNIQDTDSLNCFRWNVTPSTQIKDGRLQYMVCLDHYKQLETKFPIYIYPGELKLTSKNKTLLGTKYSCVWFNRGCSGGN